MKPSKYATSTSDDGDEQSFDFSPARGSMLLDEAAATSEAGPTIQVQVSTAIVGDASPNSSIVPSEATAAADLGSTGTPLSSAAEPAFDSGFGTQAKADTSLIRLDQFRADPRFGGIDGHGVSVVVLDTGIDLNHPFFGADANHDGVSDRIVYSYSFVGATVPTPRTTTTMARMSPASSGPRMAPTPARRPA